MTFTGAASIAGTASIIVATAGGGSRSGGSGRITSANASATKRAAVALRSSSDASAASAGARSGGRSNSARQAAIDVAGASSISASDSSRLIARARICATLGTGRAASFRLCVRYVDPSISCADPRSCGATQPSRQTNYTQNEPFRRTGASIRAPPVKPASQGGRKPNPHHHGWFHIFNVKPLGCRHKTTSQQQCIARHASRSPRAPEYEADRTKLLAMRYADPEIPPHSIEIIV